MSNAPFLINEQGEWFYNNSKITRKSMVKLFSNILVRDKDDTFHLRTPVEDVLVEVKDVPFIITSLDIVNKNNLIYISFTTNVDKKFIVGKNNPIWVEEKYNSNQLIPYAIVNDGLLARISRSVYYEMVNLLENKKIDNSLYNGVYSGKEFFNLDKPDLRSNFI